VGKIIGLLNFGEEAEDDANEGEDDDQNCGGACDVEPFVIGIHGLLGKRGAGGAEAEVKRVGVGDAQGDGEKGKDI